RIGDTVQLAYVDQARADLVPESTVWKEISGGHDTIELGPREVSSRQYVSWFNFRGGDQQKRVGDLSGGERNRVHLAKLLRSGGAPAAPDPHQAARPARRVSGHRTRTASRTLARPAASADDARDGRPPCLLARALLRPRLRRRDHRALEPARPRPFRRRLPP